MLQLQREISDAILFWINVQYVVQHPVKHIVQLFYKIFAKSSQPATVHNSPNLRLTVQKERMKHIFEKEKSKIQGPAMFCKLF